MTPSLYDFSERLLSTEYFMASLATTHASGFPPKVEPCCPTFITLMISLLVKTPETG